MRLLIAIILTILICAGFGVAMLPAMRAVDTDHDRPALALFGWVSYVLGVLALCIVLVVFTWGRISGVAFDDGGNVGDVRCQRYESYFNGKTTSYEWRTIACVELGKG